MSVVEPNVEEASQVKRHFRLFANRKAIVSGSDIVPVSAFRDTADYACQRLRRGACTPAQRQVWIVKYNKTMPAKQWDGRRERIKENSIFRFSELYRKMVMGALRIAQTLLHNKRLVVMDIGKLRRSRGIRDDGHPQQCRTHRMLFALELTINGVVHRIFETNKWSK